jgi:hypothetical protein
LTRDQGLPLEAVHPGVAFGKRAHAAAAIDRVLSDLTGSSPVDGLVSGANGTFGDAAESAAVARHFPAAAGATLIPKRGLGEAPAASALLQVIVAALEVQSGRTRRALVPVVGFNQQASAAIVAAA